MSWPLVDPESMTNPAATSDRDATPRMSVRVERGIRLFAVAVLLYSAYYIVWRWLETLNPDALWFAVPLVVAETYVLFSAALTVFTVWRLKHRQPPPAPEGLSVDVFITCYDEPVGIIRRTAVGARAIHYPHRTWILDDGNRDEVRALADELGMGYIRRANNEHAKAGNLNHAMGVTRGDFILQLDADHVPLPHILDRLLGFFRDDKVAFVQSPQDFYNTDGFSYNNDDSARRVWEEQRIFFSLLQPGKDNWNAAFFCGSCAVLRRAAFDEIGGFCTETITEDMETSLVLHERGWRSVYYAESLAYGLAPASAAQYAVQRLRWGQGSMQILRKYNPLFRKGLTWPQRLCYFDSVISYLDGPARLIFYLAPVVFFFTGVLPIYVDQQAFLLRFVPYLVLNLLAFELLFRGVGFLIIAERFNMAKFWIYTLAVSGFFARGALKFNVTPKGQGDVHFRSYAPQLILAVLTAAAVVWATLAYASGWISYEVPGWSSLAFWINLLWAVYNFYFAVVVVRMALHYKQQRADERYRTQLPIEVRPASGGPGLLAVTEDLNPDGLCLRTTTPLDTDGEVVVRLPLETRPVEAGARIVHRETEDVVGIAVHIYGLVFTGLDPAERDAIDLHCAQHAAPTERALVRNTKQPLQEITRWIYDPRSEGRRTVRLPVHIRQNGRAFGELRDGQLVEVSRRGAQLIMSEAPAPGDELHYDVPGSRMAAGGRVVSVRAIESAIGIVFAVGLRLTDVPGRSRSVLGRLRGGWRRLGPAEVA